MTEFVHTVPKTKAARCTVDDMSNREWLSTALGHPVRSSELMEMPGAGGLNGTMRRLKVEYEEADAEGRTTRTYVVKFFSPERIQVSRTFGQARECIFYENFADKLRTDIGLPEVVHAYGDMESGEKVILFEDLCDCVQSGYFFGPGSPHNWGKDLQALRSGQPTVTVEDVATAAFVNAALVHARFWKDESLKHMTWLRGAQWISGEGKELWEMAQKTVINGWATVKSKIASGSSGVRWDEHTSACIESSISKISWETYREQVLRDDYQWTLVHGDFHPANMMIRNTSDGAVRERLVLLDWEQVGLGSGPQDLAQFVISHMSRNDWRACEQRLLEAYYTTLVKARSAHDVHSDFAAQYTREQCEHDYVHGGAERWVWLAVLLATMCPDSMTQYFVDQLSAFIADHDITPDNIGMPRV